LQFGKAFDTAHEIVKLDRYYQRRDQIEKERDARAVEAAQLEARKLKAA
jgi:hypothetical protein